MAASDFVVVDARIWGKVQGQLNTRTRGKCEWEGRGGLPTDLECLARFAAAQLIDLRERPRIARLLPAER